MESASFHLKFFLMFQFYNVKGKLYLNAHSLSWKSILKVFSVSPCSHPHICTKFSNCMLKNTTLYSWARWPFALLVDTGRDMDKNGFLKLGMRSRDVTGCFISLRNDTEKVTSGDSSRLKLSPDFCRHAKLYKSHGVVATSLTINFDSLSDEKQCRSWWLTER